MESLFPPRKPLLDACGFVVPPFLPRYTYTFEAFCPGIYPFQIACVALFAFLVPECRSRLSYQGLDILTTANICFNSTANR